MCMVIFRALRKLKYAQLHLHETWFLEAYKRALLYMGYTLHWSSSHIHLSIYHKCKKQTHIRKTGKDRRTILDKLTPPTKPDMILLLPGLFRRAHINTHIYIEVCTCIYVNIYQYKRAHVYVSAIPDIMYLYNM